MQDFKNLEVWNDAMAFTDAVYKATATFPKEELYGITSQLRKAASSIAANISEGAGRGTNGEFKQFLGIAMGSTKECETWLIISQKQGYLSPEVFGALNERLDIIGRKLNKFKQAVQGKITSQQTQ